jgi:hypothetical protein
MKNKIKFAIALIMLLSLVMVTNFVLIPINDKRQITNIVHNKVNNDTLHNNMLLKKMDVDFQIVVKRIDIDFQAMKKGYARVYVDTPGSGFMSTWFFLKKNASGQWENLGSGTAFDSEIYDLMGIPKNTVRIYDGD